MFNVGQYWNPKQALLKQNLKDCKIEEAKLQLHELHSVVHSAEIYETQIQSYLDDIFNGLSDIVFRIMPPKHNATIAWNVWHITRIEDLTTNILIANSEQVLNTEWLKRMKVDIKDTGNAMSDQEIISFSNEVSLQELRNYRNAVGNKTKQIIEDLKKEDLKRKFEQSQFNKILEVGGVTEHQKSSWLLDFWGKKTVAGILLMPVTRHQIVHLNDCSKIKDKCSKICIPKK